jgi:hypothetical protein
MTETDYPALYQAANATAQSSQNAHFKTIRAAVTVGVVGAILSLYGIESRVAAIFAAIVLLLGLGFSALMVLRNFEATWYRARAVAESVKTISWRFIMCAEPFESTNKRSAATFGERLKSILLEHKHLAHEFAGIADSGDQITRRMQAIRSLPLNERMAYYRARRIEEQRSWYGQKATLNKAAGRVWFWVMIGFQSVAIVCAILRVQNPSWKYLPTEVCLVAAAGALTWIQGRRFRELAAAYSLTAQEIGIAATDLDDVSNEVKFAQFVAEAESAFSREHIQWIARKDFN